MVRIDAKYLMVAPLGLGEVPRAMAAERRRGHPVERGTERARRRDGGYTFLVSRHRGVAFDSCVFGPGRLVREQWRYRQDQIPSNRPASGSTRRRRRDAATRAKRIVSARRRPASSFVVLPSRSIAAPKVSATIRPHSSGISARGKSLGTAK